MRLSLSCSFFCCFLWLSVLSVPRPAIASSYDPAIEASKQALFIQSGAKKFTDDLQRYGEGRVKYFAQQLNIDRPLGLIGSGWMIYRNKAITVPFRSQKLTIMLDRVIVNISW